MDFKFANKIIFGGNMAMVKWGIELPTDREEFLPFWILGLSVIGIIIYAAVAPVFWVAGLSGVVTLAAAVLTTLPKYKIGRRRHVPYIIYAVVIITAFLVWGGEAALASATEERVQNTWIVPVAAAALAGLSWFFKLRAAPQPVLSGAKVSKPSQKS